MRGQILLVLAGMMIGVAAAPASLAQGVPYGSYQQTCQDIRSNGDRVYARCQRVDGGWNETSLDFGNCRGEVINIDGNLRCGGDNRRDDDNRGYNNGGYYDNRGYGNGHREGGLPPGNYKRTCRDMSVDADDNRLRATCERVDGSWKRTSLRHFERCQSMIVNDNGNLRCQR